MEPGVVLALLAALLAALALRRSQPVADPKAVPVRVDDGDEPPARG